MQEMVQTAMLETEDSGAEGEKGVSNCQNLALRKANNNSGGIHPCLRVPHHSKCFMIYVSRDEA